MTDNLVYINLETEKGFLKSVNKEIKAIHNILSYLPSRSRPKFTFTQTANETTFYNKLVSTNRLVHISGHGSPLGYIQSTNRKNSSKNLLLSDLVDYFEDEDYFLDLDCLILDSCWSAGFLWRKKIARIANPNRNLILIAAIRPLKYEHAEEFFEYFYSWLLKDPLPKNRDKFQDLVRESFNVAQYNYLINHKIKISVMRIVEL